MKAKSAKQITEISKDVEIEVMEVHNLFWESYAHRDIELRFSLCSEDVTFIGSGLHERALNKTEYKNINREGVKQFPNPFQIEFLWTNLTMLNENVACIESEVVWSQLINDEMFKELLRNTTLLKRENNKWLVTHVHGSVPDYRLKDGDYMTNEQTIIRNRELERQVFERTQDLNKTLEELEQKNRELEIESALEKVRTIAMGMREPADMLNVCKTISLQLQSLGVKEIRNVQTAIFYEQRGTYMNYEFYAKHDKIFITETVFTNNEIHNEFATKMMKGKGETFITHIVGDEVKEWIEYQKTTNVFIDKYLETASSLNYYWFSLGPVALGISTYIPLTEDEINLFTRFLRVFELAYQRYLDIEKAIAQTKEAKIEAALEKVRSSALAMKEPADMVNVCNVISDQLGQLGVKDIRNVQTAIINEQKVTYFNYQYFAAYKEGVIEETDFNKHPTVLAMVEEMKKSANSSFSGSMENIELISFREWRKQNNQFPDPILDEVDSAHYYFYSIGLGELGLTTYKPLPEEGLDIFKRFHNVFTLAYRRFIDIEKAIAQAREAKIEAALERVRAAAMAMRDSSELSELIYKLYGELTKLDAKLDRCFIMIVNPENHGITWWLAGKEGLLAENGFFIQLNQHPSHLMYLECWEKRKKKWQYLFEGKEKRDWDSFGFSNTELARLPEFIKKDMAGVKKIHLSGSSDQFGSLVTGSLEPLPEEQQDIISRFTIAFNQAFIRFLDLQKAEAQAREAKIETSLERVRSKAMAMHSSNDLSDTMAVLFTELPKLDIHSLRCGVVLLTKNSRQGVFYAAATTSESDSFTMIGSGDMSAHPVFEKQYECWMNQENYFVILSKEELRSYYESLFARLSVPYNPREHKEQTEYGYYFPFSEGMFYAWDEKPYSEAEINILNRFKAILGLTFRRYLDLQIAEAQAREATIEASLERVRAKAMAMHSPNDLSEAVSVFFNELRSLNVLPWRCGVGQINAETKTTFLTTTSNTINGESFEVRGTLQQEGHPVLDGIFEHWKMQKEFYPVLQGDEIRKYYEIIKPQIAYPKYPLDAIQYGHFIFIKEGFVFAWTENKLSEEELGIFRRFASVLSLTYRRYLDLKEAEEQNRIIQAENDRKTKELEEARQLQLSLLPKTLPRLPQFDIAVYMKTATEVGGDYYDFKVQENGVLNIGIGDATGHGLQAGTMITLMKGFFTSDVAKFNPQKFLEHCNGMIREIKLGRILMSFSHLRFDNSRLLISSAGMPPVYYHHKKNNRTEEIIIQGLPLGAMGIASYKLVEKEMSSGDTILLLTDGLPEQMNSQKVIFDYSRVLKYFDEVAENAPKDIINRLIQKADEWMDGQKQNDDITFVVIRVL